MARGFPHPLVHIELHTRDMARARAFYAQLCGWRPETIAAASQSYQALEMGGSVGGGMVECGTDRSVWLPYFEVPNVWGATGRARRLGADVLLEPREGPAGWRAVLATPAGGEIAFWQQKR